MKESSSADRRGPKTKHIESATEFGRAVQDARLRKRLTTPELAELVGVSDASVTQTEAGKFLPRKPTVKSYEQALDVSLMAAWDNDSARRKASKNQVAKSHAPGANKGTAPSPIHQPPSQQAGALATGEQVTPDVLEGRDRLVEKHKHTIRTHKAKLKKEAKKK